MYGSKILFAHRWRLINLRLENNKPCRMMGLFFLKLLYRTDNMEYKEGYVYHIKDSYFEKANDDKLMKNKENGNFRPTFYCLKDEKTSILWVVPMSSRVEKYKTIADNQVARYGESLGIYIGTYDGKPSAFLVQNMFPILENYLDHIHTRNGNPVPVKASIKQEVKKRINKARQMVKKGKKVVFPDVIRLEKLMLDEVNKDR